MNDDDAYARLVERLDRLEARLDATPPAPSEITPSETVPPEDPATPDPATPDPATPDPATPDPATPDPTTSQAAAPDTATSAALGTEELLRGDLFWALKGLKDRESVPAVLYTGVVRLPGQPGPVEWQMGHYVDDLLAEDWSDRASALSALGHPVRLQILQLIARGEASTAAELAATEGLGTTGQVYHHLKQLVSAGWLRSAARGMHHIPPERLVPLLVVLGASQ